MSDPRELEERLLELERQVERVAEAVAAFRRGVEVNAVKLELRIGGGERSDRRGDHLSPVE